MPIAIPVDVYLLAVTVMNRDGPRPVLAREIDCGLDVGHVQTGINLANRIWAPDFQFNMRTIQKVRSDLPGDTDVVGDQERWFLYGQYPARSGASLIPVRQIGRGGGRRRPRRWRSASAPRAKKPQRNRHGRPKWTSQEACPTRTSCEAMTLWEGFPGTAAHEGGPHPAG